MDDRSMPGPQLYQFRVQGKLSERTLAELAPTLVVDVQLVTVLSGCLDEAGAHGMVDGIHRFGLDLISMERVGGCWGQSDDTG